MQEQVVRQRLLGCACDVDVQVVGCESGEVEAVLAQIERRIPSFINFDISLRCPWEYVAVVSSST